MAASRVRKTGKIFSVNLRARFSTVSAGTSGNLWRGRRSGGGDGGVASTPGRVPRGAGGAGAPPPFGGGRPARWGRGGGDRGGGGGGRRWSPGRGAGGGGEGCARRSAGAPR